MARQKQIIPGPAATVYLIPVDWKALYEQCWDILVEHAGALKNQDDRSTFVRAFLAEEHEATEWRFGGTLGFGGKFWRNDGRLYVACYREDETPKRLAVIETVNAQLAALVPPGGVHGSPRRHEERVLFRPLRN